MTSTHYDTLNLSKDCSQGDIKKAYRRLAKKFHPDHNNSEEAQSTFVKIQVAYETLNNKDKRKAYDFKLYQSANVTTHSPFAPSRGFDVNVTLIVSFMEAIQGVKKSVEYPVWKQCENCKGLGHTVEVCAKCSGFGMSKEKEHLEIKVPPATKDKKLYYMDNKGGPGRDGSRGRLFITVRATSHPEFTRDDLDIYSNLTIRYFDAALGTKERIETIQGPISMKIPKNLSKSTNMIVKSMGVKHPDGRIGNHIVQVKIDNSVDTNQETAVEEAKLLEQIKNLREK